MTTTFVGSGTTTFGVNASVTPGSITGLQVDDLVLIFASIRNSGAGVPSTPTGWTRITGINNIAVFGRFWQTGDTLPAISFTGGVANADTMAQAAAFRGVAKDALVSNVLGTQANASAANIAYPALDVPAPNYTVVLAPWKQDDATAYSTPSGFTALTLASTTTGDDASQRLYYNIQTTEADLTSGSITVTGGASAISAVALLALKTKATFTATLQDEYPPRVLLTASGLTPGDSVSFYRVVAGDRTLVREADSITVTDPAMLRVDAELPFGVPVSYVAVVNSTAEYTTSAVTYDLPGGKVAVSDAITGEAAETIIISWPELSRETVSSLFRAGNRNIVVTDGLGQPTSTIELFVESDSSSANLRDLLENATSGIIQVRQPGGYTDIDSYQAVLGYRQKRFSQDGTDERRIYEIDVAEVDGWAPALEARGYTYADLEARYAGLTYADLAGDYATYLDLAQADLS